MEDDVDVLGQDTLIFFAQIQLRLREVTVHGDDLLRKARLLLLQSFKELRSRGRQSCSSMGAKCSQTLRARSQSAPSVHSNAAILHHTEMWKELEDQAHPHDAA